MQFPKIRNFINFLTSGGAERVTVNLAAYLARNGYGVTVVTMHGPERDFFRLDGKVRRICLELAGENRGLGKITANIRRIRGLRKVIKQEKPDVVLGMMTHSAIMAIIACLGLSVRVVVSERNSLVRKKVTR